MGATMARVIKGHSDRASTPATRGRLMRMLLRHAEAAGHVKAHSQGQLVMCRKLTRMDYLFRNGAQFELTTQGKLLVARGVAEEQDDEAGHATQA